MKIFTCDECMGEKATEGETPEGWIVKEGEGYNQDEVTCLNCRLKKLEFPEPSEDAPERIAFIGKDPGQRKLKGCGKYFKEAYRTCGDYYSYHEDEERPYIKRKTTFDIWLCNECLKKSKSETEVGQ